MAEASGGYVGRKRPHESSSFSCPPSKRDAASSAFDPRQSLQSAAVDSDGRFLQFFVEAPDMTMQRRRTFVVRKPAESSVQSVVDYILYMEDVDTGIPIRFFKYVKLTRRNGQPLDGVKTLQEVGLSDGVTLYIDGTIPKNILPIQQEMETLIRLVDEMTGKTSKTVNGESCPESGPLLRFTTSSRRFLRREPGADGFFFSPGVAKIFLAEGGLQVLAGVSRYEEERLDKAGRTAVVGFVEDLATECAQAPSPDRLGHHGAAIILAMLKEWVPISAIEESTFHIHQLMAHLAPPLSRALTFLFQTPPHASLAAWFNLAPGDLLTQLWELLRSQLTDVRSGVGKIPGLVVPHVCHGLRAVLGAAEGGATQGSDWGRTFGGEVYRSARKTVEGVIERRALDGPGKADVGPPQLKKCVAALVTLMQTLSSKQDSPDPQSDEASPESFRTFLEAHKPAVNALVCSNTTAFSGFQEMPWLLTSPYNGFLTLETKRRWLEHNLPDTISAESQVEISVDRRNLLADAFDKLAYEDAAELRGGGIYPTFAEEDGYGPGVRREFFVAVARQLFDPANALFLSSPLDRRRVFPSHASDCNPGHLAYFKFCGRFLALALAHRVQLGIALAPALFRLLVTSPGGEGEVCEELERLDDAADVDCDTWRSCKQLLEMKPEEIEFLELSFVCCIEKLGAQREMPLFPGGEDKTVTASSLRHFLGLKLRKQLYEPVQCQVAAIRDGFREMFTRTDAAVSDVLEPVGEKDFALILRGDPADVSLADWKAHTSYHEYAESDAQITWFWQALESFPEERRRRLLFFATAFNYLPPTGFQGLPDRFHIFRGGDGLEMLPTSHTCFLQLVLPAYDSYEMMRQRLTVVSDAHVAESFGMS